MKTIRFIDLFAGMGGFRLGLEQACEEIGIQANCVFTSEIKKPALEVYSENFEKVDPVDITKCDAEQIPDFDILLGGFPCQAFSSAGSRRGFLDTRGTLFFDIARITDSKKPKLILLENVEGLVNHDRQYKTDSIGRTLETIILTLENLGYSVSWRVLDASEFGLAQRRRRVFIVATLGKKVSLKGFPKRYMTIGNIQEHGLPTLDTDFTRLLLSHFSPSELLGKAIKDKRGGKDNIHSWDFELKGAVSDDQRELLSNLLRARRNKKWGLSKGIEWMDGMPLTVEEISLFYSHNDLRAMLEDLVNKGYLAYEHPKDIKIEWQGELTKSSRFPREDLPKGYNIVSGKLSFEISKILHPDSQSPTIVATDVERIAIVDGDGLRRLSEKEQLRLFGFPDEFKMPISKKDKFDLFGNTVPVPVVKAVAKRALESLMGDNSVSEKTASYSLQTSLF